VADAEELLRREPNSVEVRNWLAESCNNLAWLLATAPQPDRDPSRALLLARRAVALYPDSNMSINTLGLVLYRAGEYAEAIPVIERSLAANDNASIPYDLLFLALCHAKRGERVRARAYLERAEVWLRANSKLSSRADKELLAFHAEAEKLVCSLPPPLPDDVFAKD
jgi:Tfp pilus assembly protein PilF